MRVPLGLSNQLIPTVLIECQIQAENIDPRLSQDAELPSLGVLANELPQVRFFHAPRCSDAWNLKFRRRRGNVGIETTGRSGHQVDGHFNSR